MRHAADDDAPFSETMLEWLEEGDRMGEAGGAPRPSGAHHVTEHSPRRRERTIIGGAVVLAGGLVLALRLMGGGKHGEEASAKAVTTTVAAAPAGAAPVAPAPVAVAPVPVAAPVAAADPAAAAAAPVADPAGTIADPTAPTRNPNAPDPGAAPVAQGAAAPAAPAAAEPVAPPAVPVAAAAPAPVGLAPTVKVAPAPVEAPAPVAVAAAAAPVAVSSFASELSQCRSHVTAGRIRAALSSCRLAIDAQPASAEALTLLAEAEFTRGHTGEAMRLATTAANSDQNFADAYVIIGGVYQDKGKAAEARAAYEQYLALQPRGKHAADLRAILGTL